MISIPPQNMTLALNPAVGADHVGGGTPSPMAAKFDALMQNLRQLPPHDAGARGPSVVSSIVQAENASVQTVVDQVHRFNEDASTMSRQEFSAAGIALTMDTAMVMFQLNVGMGVVHSSKSAVQTLFKNQ